MLIRIIVSQLVVICLLQITATPVSVIAHEYVIEIKTSGDSYAGTDGSVYATLIGNNSQSEENILDAPGDDFETNSLGKYTVVTTKSLGVICGVIVRKSGGGAWKLEYIKVSLKGREKNAAKFSFNSWINPSEKRSLVVNGGWGLWSDWEGCMDSCGGKDRRFRSCTNPAPACGGTACEGAETDEVDCPMDDCPTSRLGGAYTTAVNNSSASNTPVLPIAVGAAAGFLMLVLLIILLIYLSRRKHKDRRSRRYNGSSSPDVVRNDHFYSDICFDSTKTKHTELQLLNAKELPLFDSQFSGPLTENPKVTMLNDVTEHNQNDTDEYYSSVDNEVGNTQSVYYENINNEKTDIPSSDPQYYTNMSGTEYPTHLIPNGDSYYDYGTVCSPMKLVSSNTNGTAVPFYHDMSGGMKEASSKTSDNNEWLENDIYTQAPEDASNH